MRNAGPANQPGLSARTQGPGGNLQFESEKGLVGYKQNIRGLLGLSAALVLSIMISVLQGGRMSESINFNSFSNISGLAHDPWR